jgi:hypothetical protein
LVSVEFVPSRALGQSGAVVEADADAGLEFDGDDRDAGLIVAGSALRAVEKGEVRCGDGVGCRVDIDGFAFGGPEVQVFGFREGDGHVAKHESAKES